MTPIARCIPLSILVALSGCAAGTDAIFQTMQSVLRPESAVDRVQLNPRIRYLRVTIHGRVTLVALGYLDPHPSGQIEVWYSGDREVLRLQQGRLAGAVGLVDEWHNVAIPVIPAWSEIARSDAAVKWVRKRDVMPGYRFGVQDSLELRRIDPPPRHALAGLDAGKLTWFEERLDSLPPARYAVEITAARETVIYGEQCISRKVCFTWQRWPAIH